MEAILRSQADLQNRITRAQENLRKMGAAKITKGAIESRIHLVDSYWQKFEQNDETLRSRHWSAVEKHEYITRDFLGAVEDTYLQVRGAFADMLQSLTSSPSTENATATTAERPISRSALPRINMPVFSGHFEDWPSFRDLFAGHDRSLSAVERLHYLKTSVRGEAEQLIRCLSTTGENFQRAWTTLSEHYENRRLLVNSYCSAFLAVPRMRGETVADLRRVYHGMTAAVGSLETVGGPALSSPDLFIHLVVGLLDARTRREWELASGGTSEPPSYETLRKFLESRLQMLVAMVPARTEASASVRSDGAIRSVRAHHVRNRAKPGRCTVCSGNHYVLFCDGYKKKQSVGRKQFVEDSGLCLNCLGKHSLSDCKFTRTCMTCNLKHHTTLHEACVRRASGEAPSAVTAHLVRQPRVASSRVLLTTTRVLVRDRFGVLHETRAMVDPAAETSLVAESLVQRLRLPRERVSVQVFGVGEHPPDASRGLVGLAVFSRFGGAAVDVRALILKQITVYGRGADVSIAPWPHLRDLDLANPDSGAGGSVELLLGAEVYPAILRSGTRGVGPRAPVAQETSLGWILTGADGRDARTTASSVHVCSIESELLSRVWAFWEQEELPPSPRPDFSGSHRAALGSLRSMERRFEVDRDLQRRYAEFMCEYAALGHMVPALPPVGPHHSTCYLPHHGVIKVTDSVTKLRVVFNGSSLLPSGDTLNQHLMVGPNLVPALADVLLRWRRHRFALATDIEKMYRQVQVHPSDWRLQRVLWSKPDEAQVVSYSLTTVTYGLSCAPYLAVRTLQQLASDEEGRFPRGAAVHRRDTYVDDILFGAGSIAETLELRDQLTSLCGAGGFPLRKWVANSGGLLTGIPHDHLATQGSVMWEQLEFHSTLGLQWNAREDCFAYKIRHQSEDPITRRGVLSRTAGLYDPLGWLSPVIVRAKIFIQQTWLLQLGWDQPLGNSETKEWRALERALPLLGNVCVPRWLRTSASTGSGTEVHGFADASERAYAWCTFFFC